MLLDALWLNVSPSLSKLNQPLLNCLSKQVVIAEWQYCQELDEPNSLSVALDLLHDYLNKSSQPLHLIGHGISGSLGLLYARQYPEKVRSLTLLSVGAYPAIDWQSYYYSQLASLPCGREMLLTRMVDTLFGYQSESLRQEFRHILDQDLRTSLSPHNLYQQVSIFPGGTSIPLLICGSRNDAVIEQHLLQGWSAWLKKEDCLWEFPRGRYFFHYFYPQRVSKKILNFWLNLFKLSFRDSLYQYLG